MKTLNFFVKQKLGRILFTFLLGFISSNNYACELTFTGPTCVQPGEIVVYEMTGDGFGFNCTPHAEATFLGGEILGVEDEAGNRYDHDITSLNSSNWLTDKGLPSSLVWPIKFFVKYDSSGCKSAYGRLSASGLTCPCWEEVSIDVQVGFPQSFGGIEFIGDEPIRNCDVIELCYDRFSNCTDIVAWKVNGIDQGSTDECIKFNVTSCPVNVDLEVTNPCTGKTNLRRDLLCNQIDVPITSYPTLACLGHLWSLEVPGYLVNLDVLSFSNGGNQVEVNRNTISFLATNPGSVVMSLTYEICGIRHNLFIHVLVSGCDFIQPDDQDSENDLAINLGFDKRITSQKVFPNPTTGILYLESDMNEDLPESIKIMDASNRVLKEISPSRNLETVDITEFPNGVYYVQFTSGKKTLNTQKFILAK